MYRLFLSMATALGLFFGLAGCDRVNSDFLKAAGEIQEIETGGDYHQDLLSVSWESNEDAECYLVSLLDEGIVPEKRFVREEFLKWWIVDADAANNLVIQKSREIFGNQLMKTFVIEIFPLKNTPSPDTHPWDMHGYIHGWIPYPIGYKAMEFTWIATTKFHD